VTPAEGRLAERLAAGEPLAAAARSLGISATTAKSHLARLFEKTGTSRQADLVQLLVSLGS
jgi:DNA-binding CsgD family transcriptional regulator